MTKPQKHSALPYKKHSKRWKRKREAYLWAQSRTEYLTYEFIETTTKKIRKKVFRDKGFQICRKVLAVVNFARQLVMYQQGSRVRELEVFCNWKGFQGIIV